MLQDTIKILESYIKYSNQEKSFNIKSLGFSNDVKIVKEGKEYGITRK